MCSPRLHALANGSAVRSDVSRGVFVAADCALYHQSKTSSALQLVVPVVFQHDTVAARRDAPSSGGLGINKTIRALVLDYQWDTMRRDAERYVRVCDACQRQKATRHYWCGMQHNLTYVAVWGCVSIDVARPFSPRSRPGNTCIVVVVDNFSHKRWSYAPPNQAAAIVVALLCWIFVEYGGPARLLSDRGSNFLSDVAAELLRSEGGNRVLTS